MRSLEQKGIGIIPNMKSKHYIMKDIRNNFYNYILIFPAFIYTLLFGYITLPYMLTAFQRFSYTTGIFNSKWVGFDNFKFFFKTDYAFTVTMNTIKLNFLFIMFCTLVAVTFAILLNEAGNKLFVKVTQSTFVLPYFISWIIASYIIYNLFSTDFGVVNQLLKSAGLQPVDWYSKPAAWPWILVVMRVWKFTGYNVVIYLASITGIDSEIYEAGTIDGANRWQKIKYITIPLLMPTVAMMTLLSIGRIFYGDFGMIYSIVQDNGVLFPTTDVIDTYLFRQLRKVGDTSWAMAVNLYQSMLGFIFVYFSNRIARKYFKEGALF